MNPSKRLRGRMLAVAQTIKALEGRSDEKESTIEHYGLPFLDKVLKDLQHREDREEIASLLEDKKKALEGADSEKERRKVQKEFNRKVNKKWEEHPWTTRMKSPSWMGTSVELEKAMQKVTDKELDKAEVKRLKRNLKRFQKNNLPEEKKNELVKILEELGSVIAEEIKKDIQKQQEITEAITLDVETAFTQLR